MDGVSAHEFQVQAHASTSQHQNFYDVSLGDDHTLMHAHTTRVPNNESCNLVLFLKLEWIDRHSLCTHFAMLRSVVRRSVVRRHALASLFHHQATPAGYQFALASLPPVRQVPSAGFANKLHTPYYGPQSPTRAALKEVLATLHDVAHNPRGHCASGLELDTRGSESQGSELDARGRGVCVVGSKGTGTSTVLHTAVDLTRELLPQYERVVYWSAGRGRTNTRRDLLDHMLFQFLGDRHHTASGPWALFVDDAHYLTPEEWNTMRLLLKPLGVRKRARHHQGEKGDEKGDEETCKTYGTKGGEADFVADPPPFCVIAAGDHSTMTRIKEYESGDVHAYFSRVTVQPMQTLAEYRAFHQHALQDVRRYYNYDLDAAAVPTTREIDNAARKWHFITGGNLGSLLNLQEPESVLTSVADAQDPYHSRSTLSSQDNADARNVKCMLRKSWTNATPAQVCVDVLRRKLPKRAKFCPFEAGAMTATSDEMRCALLPLLPVAQAKCRAAADAAVSLDLRQLCDEGFLRVVPAASTASTLTTSTTSTTSTALSNGNLDPDTCYALGRPFLALTLEEWWCEWSGM